MHDLNRSMLIICTLNLIIFMKAVGFHYVLRNRETTRIAGQINISIFLYYKCIQVIVLSQ